MGKLRQRVRVGVIGCGKIAEVGHLPWLKRNPDAEIVAVADPHEKNLARAAKRYDVKRAYSDGLALIDAGGLDAVVICSPQWAHREQVLAALSANLHVLCEKPLASSVAETDAIANAAAARPELVVQVAFQKRFQRGFEVMRELIASGAIGTPIHAHVYWYNWVPDFELPWMKKLVALGRRFGIDPARDLGAWRQLDARSGGGDFLDHGPHYFDLFRYWLGEIESLTAHTRKLHPSFVYEDQANVLLKFACGATGSIERSMNIIGRPHGEEIGYVHGTEGSLYWDAPHEYTLKPVSVKKYSTRNVILDRASRVPVTDAGLVSYQRQTDHFISAITGSRVTRGALPRGFAATLEDGRRAIELVHLAYESSRLGATLSAQRPALGQDLPRAALAAPASPEILTSP